jgi:hypothetical protein
MDAADAVRRILAGLQPILGSPGERYLGETRGIDTTVIAGLIAEPRAIGWHEGVYFNQRGHALHGQRLGCIVGVMSDPVSGEPTGAISRTYIGSDGKKVGKAKSLGQGGGVARLSRDEDVLEGLFLGSGLETCLAAAAHSELACCPIWSTGSDSTMRTFPVLNGIACLSLVADHDENGAGLGAAQEAAERWLDQEREVRIISPKAVGDLNDIVKQGGGGA